LEEPGCKAPLQEFPNKFYMLKSKPKVLFKRGNHTTFVSTSTLVDLDSITFHIMDENVIANKTQ
jgi:hypothetical protein